MSNRELNFEFLCRVCAAQTKGKNSVAECVYILKTPELKEKIQRLLNLTVTADDNYPKVLCKTCFRQVEATASLAKIAQHTQTVFRNFIFNQFTNPDVFTPLDMICKEIEKPTSLLTLPPKQPVPPLVPYREELVVNVSVSDPLTRETQEKMISASQKRQSFHEAQKRQSLTDARHVPKSIAQRSLSVPKALNDVGSNASTANRKSSPAGVINFFHGNQPQVTPYSSVGYVVGNATSTTTSGSMSGTSNSSVSTSEAKRKNLQKTLNKIKATNSGQVSLLKVSQKNSNSLGPSESASSKAITSPSPHDSLEPPSLSHTLSIIKPSAVSIPTSVQRSSDELQPNVRKSNKGKSIPLTRDVDVLQADELPAQIIIASTKNRKNSNSSMKERDKGGVDGPSGIATAIPRADVADEILLGRVIKDVDLLKLILKALKWPVTMQTMELQMARLKSSRFSEIMSDQNLLQDTDLTQLLSPYLAPILYAAQALQQNVPTPNPPTTSTQSYMPPFKPIDLQAAAITSAIPYKLPAETSVQLVPASPEREDPSPPQSATTGGHSVQMTLMDSSNGTEPPLKRPRKTPKQKPVEAARIFPIDVEDIRLAISKSETALPKAKNALKKCSSHYNLATVNAGQATRDAQVTKLNEELRLLLERQNAATKNVRRKRANSNSILHPSRQTTNDTDLDDIILLENESSIKNKESNEGPTTSKEAAKGRAQALTKVSVPNSESEASSNVTDTSVITSAVKSSENSGAKSESDFQVPMPPMVPRPIIKRRKTVIQTSSRSSLLTNSASDSDATMGDTPKSSAELFVINKTLPPLQRRPSLSVSELSESSVASANQEDDQKAEDSIQNAPPTVTKSDDATNSTETPSSTKSSEETAASAPPKGPVKRLSSSKSSLGQQLLEAIGLQKITSNSTGNAVSNSSLAGRDSVQAVRSALKLSLKQAQQRKQVETVKQVADSTTKSNAHDSEDNEQIERSEGGESRIDSVNVESVSQKKVIDKNEEKEDSENIDKDDENTKKVNESRRKILNTKKANLPPHTDSENSPMDKSDQSKSNDKKDIIIENSPKDSEEIKTALEGTAVPPKKRGRKRNDVKEAERKERELREAESKSKLVEEDESVNNTSPSGRPTRHSKTMSKYYKPEKQSITRRSVSTRSTRSRN